MDYYIAPPRATENRRHQTTDTPSPCECYVFVDCFHASQHCALRCETKMSNGIRNSRRVPESEIVRWRTIVSEKAVDAYSRLTTMVVGSSSARSRSKLTIPCLDFCITYIVPSRPTTVAVRALETSGSHGTCSKIFSELNPGLDLGGSRLPAPCGAFTCHLRSRESILNGKV